MITRLKLLWRAWRRRADFERGLDDELAFHRDMHRDELVAQGVPFDEATRRATVALGLTGLHRDGCRRARGLAVLDVIAGDLRFAWRALTRHRGYSVTALVVLAVALAANAVLLALFNGYAFAKPPLARVDAWLSLRAETADARRIDRWSIADADALLRDPPAQLDGIHALRDITLPVTADVTRPAFGEAVSDGYFAALGIAAQRGRVIDPATARDVARPVVLSDIGWRRLLHGADDVVGRTITLAGRDFTIVGIAQPDFTGTTIAAAYYWIREADYRVLRPAEADDAPRLDVGAFLRDGADAREAQLALAARIAALDASKPPDERRANVIVEPRRGYLRAGDIDELVTIGTPAALAFAALLLVAAANLANLVLARFAARRRELAVRAAVGASRARLVSQLMVECVVLSGVAAVIGFAVAAFTVDPLHRAVFGLLGDFGMELRDIVIDARVFAAVLGLAFVAALTFGGLPALLATAPWRRGASADPAVAASVRGGDGRVRGALMIAQLATSVVLLVVAGVIAGNARVAERLALGYEPSRLIAVQVDGATPRLVDAFAALPAVETVSAVMQAPLLGSLPAVDARVDDRSLPLRLRRVDEHYLDALALKPLHGRAFTRADTDGAPVAMISAKTARRLWPDASAIGRVIDLPPQEGLADTTVGRYEVIGVVEDVVSGLFIAGTDATAVYLPLSRDAGTARGLLLRVRDDSAATREAVLRACTVAAPDATCALVPLANALRLQHVPFAMSANIAAALGWTALAISCVGLYGLTGYLVTQRRREIGVRLALGATARRVIAMLLRRSARQVAIALAIGLPLAAGVAAFAASVIPSLRVVDPVAFVAMPLLLALLALAAAWWPARRITGIAASEALRHD